jgi:hypothetical protein
MVGGLAGGKAKSRGGYGPPGTVQNKNVFVLDFLRKTKKNMKYFLNCLRSKSSFAISIVPSQF